MLHNPAESIELSRARIASLYSHIDLAALKAFSQRCGDDQPAPLHPGLGSRILSRHRKTERVNPPKLNFSPVGSASGVCKDVSAKRTGGALPHSDGTIAGITAFRS